MNYVDVITRSFQLWKAHRSFWLLGLLMALCGRSEYRFGANFNQRISTTPTPGGGSVPELPEFLRSETFTKLLANIIPIVAAIVAISIILWFIFTLLAWFIHGALIEMIATADQNQQPSWQAGFQRSRQQVGALCIMELLIALPGFVLIIGALLLLIPLARTLFSTIGSEVPPNPAAIMAPLLGGFFCLLPLLLIVALLQIIFYMIQRLAVRYCVLEQLGVGESFRKGWQLFRKNIGYSILTWGLSAVVGFLFALIAALPTLLFIIPAAQGILAGNWSGPTIGLLAGLIIYSLVVGIGAGGILTSFNVTVWSVLFRRFREAEDTPAFTSLM